MDENKTCSTCKYKRIMPIWETTLKLEIKYFCCRDKFVSVNPDDTCEHWETALDESVTGTSFNKN